MNIDMSEVNSMLVDYAEEARQHKSAANEIVEELLRELGYSKRDKANVHKLFNKQLDWLVRSNGVIIGVIVNKLGTDLGSIVDADLFKYAIEKKVNVLIVTDSQTYIVLRYINRDGKQDYVKLDSIDITELNDKNERVLGALVYGSVDIKVLDAILSEGSLTISETLSFISQYLDANRESVTEFIAQQKPSCTANMIYNNIVKCNEQITMSTLSTDDIRLRYEQAEKKYIDTISTMDKEIVELKREIVTLTDKTVELQGEIDVLNKKDYKHALETIEFIEKNSGDNSKRFIGYINDEIYSSSKIHKFVGESLQRLYEIKSVEAQTYIFDGNYFRLNSASPKHNDMAIKNTVYDIMINDEEADDALIRLRTIYRHFPDIVFACKDTGFATTKHNTGIMDELLDTSQEYDDCDDTEELEIIASQPTDVQQNEQNDVIESVDEAYEIEETAETEETALVEIEDEHDAGSCEPVAGSYEPVDQAETEETALVEIEDEHDAGSCEPVDQAETEEIEELDEAEYAEAEYAETEENAETEEIEELSPEELVIQHILDLEYSDSVVFEKIENISESYDDTLAQNGELNNQIDSECEITEEHQEVDAVVEVVDTETQNDEPDDQFSIEGAIEDTSGSIGIALAKTEDTETQNSEPDNQVVYEDVQNSETDSQSDDIEEIYGDDVVEAEYIEAEVLDENEVIQTSQDTASVVDVIEVTAVPVTGHTVSLTKSEPEFADIEDVEDAEEDDIIDIDESDIRDADAVTEETLTTEVEDIKDIEDIEDIEDVADAPTEEIADSNVSEYYTNVVNEPQYMDTTDGVDSYVGGTEDIAEEQYVEDGEAVEPILIVTALSAANSLVSDYDDVIEFNNIEAVTAEDVAFDVNSNYESLTYDELLVKSLNAVLAIDIYSDLNSKVITKLKHKRLDEVSDFIQVRSPELADFPNIAGTKYVVCGIENLSDLVYTLTRICQAIEVDIAKIYMFMSITTESEVIRDNYGTNYDSIQFRHTDFEYEQGANENTTVAMIRGELFNNLLVTGSSIKAYADIFKRVLGIKTQYMELNIDGAKYNYLDAISFTVREAEKRNVDLYNTKFGPVFGDKYKLLSFDPDEVGDDASEIELYSGEILYCAELTEWQAVVAIIRLHNMLFKNSPIVVKTLVDMDAINFYGSTYETEIATDSLAICGLAHYVSTHIANMQ